MKKDKKKAPRVRKVTTPDVVDYTPLFMAFTEAFEWALNVASALSRDYPEEVEAVERVRAFMRARLAGKSASVNVDDVLFTFGLLIGAIERDLGPIGNVGPWFAPPLTMQFPTAPERRPKVPRVFLGNLLWTHGAPTHFAVA